ncbi:phage protein [Streptococcus agalactiae]|uniref:transcriptional regulator n=1 Tax=Streptococcus agalactiae TaxID=1311 RepID=UPI0005E3FBA8|nr:transcriptional regulator [Streptococcus agalactiae]CNC89539.1 phage protein [Streptococcus agalactiae]CNG60622.1 phage protein [Streptococcus agalactiae]
MSKLSNAQLKAFDEWLFDYRDIERKIAIRKLELQTLVNEDTNIGGGRVNVVSKPTENIIAKWGSDGQIISYENFRDRVDEVKEILDDELNYIFDLRWGFRVIIVIEANSYVNIRSSRLLPKFKTQKINSWCAA